MTIEAISVLGVGSTRQPSMCSHPLTFLKLAPAAPCGGSVSLYVYMVFYGVMTRDPGIMRSVSFFKVKSSNVM